MISAHSLARIVAGTLACLMAFTFAAHAPAQTIDLALNLSFEDPEDDQSGGTWEIVGKSTNSGIASLSLRVMGINSGVTFRGPRGTVNGSDGAGFWIVGNNPIGEGVRNIILGQAPIAPSNFEPGNEQSLFYGVGTLVNGAPNYPGKPPGTNSIGPAFTSLTNVQNVPWAPPRLPNDPFNIPGWQTAATFATGSFAEGTIPDWFSGNTGQVFMNVGSSTTFTPPELATLINTFVRTNLTSGPGGDDADYNNNGVVDAADYVLWRKGVLPDADGNGNGSIDAGDYDLWRAQFGSSPGSGSGAGSVSAPEPASAMLFLLGFAVFSGLGRAPRRR